MDGYLSKPIRPQELDEIRDKYVARRIDSVKAIGRPQAKTTDKNNQHPFAGTTTMIAAAATDKSHGCSGCGR